MSKSDEDTNLLKLDMRITAKRLKLKEKGGHKLPVHSGVLSNAVNLETFNKFPVIPSTILRTNNQKGSAKENKTKVFATHRKKIIRRPANYTWNRGGRLKEIRIRTQARKFLHIWIKKTFGKFLYSQAHFWHQRRLKTKCLYAWKSFWWDNCGEMKLWIRAECFDRYRRYGRVWCAWKQFAIQNKKKKADLQVALNHFSVVTSQKHIKLWKLYVQVRRMKKALYNKAYSIAKSNIERSTWNAWNNAIHLKHDNLAKQDVATCHWAEHTQAKVLKKWLCRYNESLRFHDQSIVARQQYTTTILKKAMSSWSIYVIERRRKGRLYRTARNWHNLCVKHRTMSDWWMRYEKLLSVRAQREVSRVLSIRCVKRRFFLLWLQFVEDSEIQRRKEAIAVISHRKRLLKNALAKMKLAVHLKEWKTRMLYAAIHFYANSLISNSWRRWQHRLEVIEDRELTELSSLAKEHYRCALVKKMFTAMIVYTHERRRCKQNAIKAEAHFVVKALPRRFANWRRFVDEVKDVNQMKKDALVFHTEVLNTKYFYLWYSNYEQAHEVRTMERMAAMQHSENTLRHHFQIWSNRTRQILKTSRKDAIARVHYRRALLKLAIKRWLQYNESVQTRKKSLMRAASYHHHRVLVCTWLSWRDYVTDCRQKQAKTQLACHQHASRLLERSMQTWKVYHEKSKAIKAEVNRRYDLKNKALLRVSLTTWRNNCVQLIDQRKSVGIAESHRKHHLQATVFKSWREWSILHYYKKVQTVEKADESAAILNQLKICRMFCSWKKATNAARLERLNVVSANKHFNGRICRLVLHAWRLYRYIQLKKMLMRRQADMSSASRITRNFLSRWKDALENTGDEDKKTGDALWHWAMTLQGRCFDGWKAHTAMRKKNKERYERAMGARRIYMLKNGCAKFLSYYSDKLADRTRLAACQQAQLRYSAYHLAWKYGKRWITKIRRRIEMKTTNQASSFQATACTQPRKVEATSFVKSSFSLPFQITRDPLSTTPFSKLFEQGTTSPKRRLSPRLPEFLDESLRRDGLISEHVVSSSRVLQPTVLPGSPPFQKISSSESKDHEETPGCSTAAFPPVTTSPELMPHQFSNLISSTMSSSSSSGTLVMSSPERAPYSPPLCRRVSSQTSMFAENEPADMVLLPPSAFALPIDQSAEPSSPSSSYQWSNGRKSFICDSGIGDVNEGRKETFKTFVASPGQECDELSIIYSKLQDFQHKKQQLKVLRQQKEVLEEWINENLSTMQTSSSLDMASVQEEIAQIDAECAALSSELLHRKPEVEKLAVRVKVLCARPT